MVIILLLLSFLQMHPVQIKDRVNLEQYVVENYFLPLSINDLKTYIATHQGPFSIIGKGYSQGGQAITEKGSVLDLSKLNKIIAFDKDNKTITVEAGATWEKLQEYIDPFDLSLEGVQSYNDFSVGGSVAVNCHGRDLSGSLENSIVSLTVLTANGDLVTASENENKELFQACIGGYGLVGIIVNATFKLTFNNILVKKVKLMPLTAYSDYFKNTILSDPNTNLHSAIVWFGKKIHLTAVTFSKNHEIRSKDVQISRRLRRHKEKYVLKTGLETLYRRLRMIKPLRSPLEFLRSTMALKAKNKYYFRNYEMSQTVKTLEPLTRFFSTSFLQEYFIPCDKIEDFIIRLNEIQKMYDVNVVNATLRFVPAQKKSLLSYAPVDCFACVLYINIWNNDSEIDQAHLWTQQIIEAALACNGTYYLPYQLYATQEQFKRAYPSSSAFLDIKKKFDPANKFQNKLFQKYMN